MTAPTPCRGQYAVYDAALNGQERAETRRQAQTIAAALCGRCPIAHACTDRVTAPAQPPRNRKAPAMPDTTPAPRPTPQLVAPATETLSTAEALIAWGSAHPTIRVKSLAAKAGAALADLRKASERETAVADAEARVKRLKAQLANAENDLKAAKGGTPNAPSKAGDSHRSGTEELRAIRKWAAANGYRVAPKGTVARSVVDAYRAANPAPLANAS